MRVGAIGLGDLGSGFTQNLIANGFEATGLGPRETRLTASHDMGGTPAGIVTEVGGICDAVCETVMNGDQAKLATLGDADLARHKAEGGAINLTATTMPREPREPGFATKGCGFHRFDASNSGGIPGTRAGALMMTASPGMQIILAAKSKCPQGMELARARVTEKVLDTELHQEGLQ